MRHTLPIAALLPLMLAACASSPNMPVKAIDQSGTLKVHPGLLGQPVPPELQPLDAPAASVAEGAPGMTGEAQSTGVLKDNERSVYFDLDSTDIRPTAATVLKVHADRLAKNANARVRVEGNADERGPADYNRKLGLKRAEAVRQFLVSNGAAEKQVKAVSRGESNPKLRGHDEESWAENRRADIVYEKE
ncbi:MAG TPA: OmpA family protein [Rhodocyclaceae bacterium]|nr:OmpA family protein [Rhodocyclaceae bacterium]